MLSPAGSSKGGGGGSACRKSLSRPSPSSSLSSSLVHDRTVRVWDLRRPYIPVLSFEQHKEVVTGLFWDKDGMQVLYSCSKDGVVMRNAVTDALQPATDAAERSHGICWEPRGGMARFDDSQPPAARLATMQRGGLVPQQQQQQQQTSRAATTFTAPPQPGKTLSSLRVLPRCDPSM